MRSDEFAIQLNVRSRWMTYALDPAGAAPAVAAEVDGMIARHPDLHDRRRLLTDLLAGQSAGARGDEAVLGALRFEDHPRYGDSTASMTGWLIARDPTRSASQELGGSLARFAVRSRPDRFPPQAARLRLPVGDCVRVVSSRQLPASDGGGRFRRTVFRTFEYHVPFDRPHPALLFVRFMTANLAHADALADEFEALVADLVVLPKS